ncbi:MAG: M56 family metallopeptidase [Petrimonas sp.]|nr:M56 family metallopeptidase [Petrimonas sp.]
MGAFILYMAKASVCLLFFSIFFRLLMMRETFFRFNRVTLLAGLVVCSLMPMINLQTINPLGFQRPIAHLEKMINTYEYLPVTLPETDGSTPAVDTGAADAQTGNDTVSEKKSFPLFGIVFLLYLLGVLFMLVRMAVSVFRLQQVVRKNKAVKHNGYELIVSKEKVVPFSFFRKIVISEADYAANPDEIILHEQMHIDRRHSVDVIISELFLAMHWFNPAVWSLSRDLREIHEYEADSGVLEHGVNPQKYQLLLVKKAVGEKQFGAITNGFNQPKIRNRIMMMLRSDSTAWARLKALAVLPIFAVVLLSFSQPVAKQQNELRYDDGEIIRNEEFKDSYALIEKRYTDNSIIVFLNSKNELLFMTRHSDAASIKALQLENKAASVQSLEKIILSQLRVKDLHSIDFILIAPEDAYMQTITQVKNVMVKAYESALSELEKGGKGVALHDLPLTIKYTMHRYQTGGEVDIAEKLMQVIQ